MSLADRGIRRSVRAQQDERTVYNEDGLVMALAEFAARGATIRSILIAEPIYLSGPCYLSAAHDGLILRGLGEETGLFNYGIQTVSATPAFAVRDMTVNGLTLVAGGTDTWPGVRFDRVKFTAALSVTSVKDITFTNCTTPDSLAVSLVSCNNAAIQDSKWRGTTTLTSNLGLVVANNRNLGPTTMSNSNAAVTINGNILVGAVDTSLGGGLSVVVGNYRNGFALTTHASDTVASNHA